MEPLDSLVRAAQEGDTELFNRIVERFQDMACASAYAMVKDVHLAEDVAQEAFLEAYLKLAKLREPPAFSSWFRRIVLKHPDRLTRGQCLAGIPLEVIAGGPMDSHNPTEIVETNELRARIHHAISALPERERLVIVLFYGTGYALKEIAAFLDMPVTTVKKRLYDARQQLKDELIDVVRDVLQEQRPSITDTFPAKVRLLIAARLGDINVVKKWLARSPMPLNMKTKPAEARYQRVLSVVAGLTALHEPAMHNHALLAQLLPEHLADPHALTTSRSPPLPPAV